MSSLGVAVVGCGNIGQVHIDRWKSIGGVELLTCVDVERERARQMSEKYHIPNFHESLDPVLKDDSVDILDVCTPTYTHREIVEAALEYGKNVIVEKPIALKLKDAESMICKAGFYSNSGRQIRNKPVYTRCWKRVSVCILTRSV